MVIPISPIPAVVRSSASHLCKNKYIRRYICDHGLREINTHMYMDTRGGAPRSLQIPGHFLIQPPPTMKEVRTYCVKHETWHDTVQMWQCAFHTPAKSLYLKPTVHTHILQSSTRNGWNWQDSWRLDEQKKVRKTWRTYARTCETRDSIRNMNHSVATYVRTHPYQSNEKLQP